MAAGANITLPEHLSDRAKSLYGEIFKERGLAGRTAQQLTLLQAVELIDRAESARELVERDGMTIRDRFEQEKDHPALRVERQCRTAAAALLGKLPWC